MSQFVTASTDATATATYGRRYVFATLDQTSLAIVTRADWTFTPALSLQLYAQPFVASGGYKDFKELEKGGTFDYAVYGRDRGTIALVNDVYRIDPTPMSRQPTTPPSLLGSSGTSRGIAPSVVSLCVPEAGSAGCGCRSSWMGRLLLRPLPCCFRAVA